MYYNLEATLSKQEVTEYLAAISHRIPNQLLAHFNTDREMSLYVSMLGRLFDETLNESSTILQALVVERCAFYFTHMREMEIKDKQNFKVSQEYKFYVTEYNRNLDTLRQLAIRNLPAQQARLLAKKTIMIIEKLVDNQGDKDKIIREIIAEFSVEVPVKGFKAAEVNTDSLEGIIKR